MTVHLVKERDSGDCVDTWCGKDSARQGLAAADDVERVDCEACLFAAYGFGEECMTRLYALWDAQDAEAERADRAAGFTPPREVMHPPGREITTVTLNELFARIRDVIRGGR